MLMIITYWVYLPRYDDWFCVQDIILADRFPLFIWKLTNLILRHRLLIDQTTIHVVELE
jgi:hypothetical protein